MTTKYDFSLNQGTDFTLQFGMKDPNGKAIDLTGYSAAMQMRQKASNIIAIDTLTTANGRIIFEPEDGVIKITFPHEVTENYPAGDLYYDLELVSGGNQITRLMQGKIKVIEEVTRVEPNYS